MLYQYYWSKWGEVSVGIIKAETEEEAKKIAVKSMRDKNVEVKPLIFDEDNFAELYYG